MWWFFFVFSIFHTYRFIITIFSKNEKFGENINFVKTKNVFAKFWDEKSTEKMPNITTPWKGGGVRKELGSPTRFS